MRKMLMVTAAALALGATGAIAAPHGGPGGGGHAAAIGGGGMHGSMGGGMAHGPMGGGMASPNMHANVGGAGNFAAHGNFAARGNVAPNFAAAPNHMTPGRGNRFAFRGDRDHDHDRWHGGGYWGGYGGLYAFGGPDYDDDYDYYGGDNCYQQRWVPTPYGWRWRDVWVCD